VYSSKNITDVIYNIVYNLNLKHKLLAMTSNSISNNYTLIKHLHNQLLTEFDKEKDLKLSNLKLLMRFQGKKLYI